MGFGDFLKSAGSAIASGAQKKMQIAQEAREEGMYMDPDRLLEKCRNSSGDRRIGYVNAAKARGLL